MRTATKWLIGLAAGAGLAALAATQLPYERLVQGKLITLLEEAGVPEPQLTVTGLGWRGIELSDIRLGQGGALQLPKAQIAFDPRLLWESGRLQDIALDGITLTVDEAAGGLASLYNPSTPGSGSDAAPYAALAALPFSTLKLTNAVFEWKGEERSLRLPFDLLLQGGAAPALTFTAGKSQAMLGGQAFTLAALSLNATLDAAAMALKGTVNATDITGTSIPEQIGALHLTGTLEGDSAQLRLPLSINNTTKDLQGALDVTLPWNAPDAVKVDMSRLAYRWQGGSVTTAHAPVWPMPEKGWRVTLDCTDLPLDALLPLLGEGKAKATGKLNGKIPLGWHPKQGLFIGKGELTAGGAGLLQLSPAMVPGEGEQITTIRTLLGDFHYTDLSLLTGENDKGKFQATLAINGSNPAVYGGKVVKLRVNLGGDVLNFVQYSILPTRNPKDWLEQQQHAP